MGGGREPTAPLSQAQIYLDNSVTVQLLYKLENLRKLDFTKYDIGMQDNTI